MARTAYSSNTRSTRSGGLFGRRRHNHHAHNTHHSAPHATIVVEGPGATNAPHHHHRRRPSIGDKISGAMMKLRGTLTRRPGLKAAGTRRMHGTDGRGSHRY